MAAETCRWCSRSLLTRGEQRASACLICRPVLVAAHERLAIQEAQSEPVEAPMGDPERGGSPLLGEVPVDQRAPTVPSPPPDRDTTPMTDCGDEP